MADKEGWAERLAARATGTKSGAGAPGVGRPAPAWSRVAAAKATGQEPDAEDVAAVERGKRPPRTKWEKRLLERLGYTEDTEDGPPPAA